MQLFCAAVCFLFTAVVSLKTSKLAFGSNSDVFDVALLCSLTETLRGLNSCICALTSFSEGSCSTLLPFQGGAGAKKGGKRQRFPPFFCLSTNRCYLLRPLRSRRASTEGSAPRKAT